MRKFLQTRAVTASAAVIVVAGGLGLSGCSANADDPARRAVTETCQQAVEGRLKSPSTAEFTMKDVDGSDDRYWQVAGYVDSENVNAAMIRTHFTCTVSWIADSQTTSLTDVTTREQ